MNTSKTSLRVRYIETDKMGIVHHSAYLAYFEIARTELLRGKGVTYRELEEKGYYLPLNALEVKYRKPLYYDDTIAIITKIEEATPLRFSFCYEIKKDECLITEAKTYHVVTDFSGKPKRLPRELFNMIGETK